MPGFQPAQLTPRTAQCLELLLLQPKPEVKVSLCPKDMQQVLQFDLTFNQSALGTSNFCNPRKQFIQLTLLFFELSGPVRTFKFTCSESFRFPDELNYTT
ncbi:hypothetical protein D3C81_1572410 [compost metagenome]